MTYRPAASVFGPPWTQRVPSLVYLAVALTVVALVIIGERAPSNSWLHVYVVERDVQRVLGARTLAFVLLLSALAAIVRSGMRGVRLRPDGVEYRDVLALGWPRVKRFRWAQIDCIILDQQSIALDLWDGTRAYLPDVSDRDGLSAALEKVGAARAIPVQGGVGLDELPDSNEYEPE